jgi:hypothetical protein
MDHRDPKVYIGIPIGIFHRDPKVYIGIPIGIFHRDPSGVPLKILKK